MFGYVIVFFVDHPLASPGLLLDFTILVILAFSQSKINNFLDPGPEQSMMTNLLCRHLPDNYTFMVMEDAMYSVQVFVMIIIVTTVICMTFIFITFIVMTIIVINFIVMTI